MCQAREEGYANGNVNSSQLNAWMAILHSCLVHTHEEAMASAVRPSTSVLHTPVSTNELLINTLHLKHVLLNRYFYWLV